MARCRPEDCNLETDNLTIIWYHNYSGGKFMANCLSLSDHGLFGHKEITEAQLRGDFSPDDKLKYLLGELSEIEKGMTWTDLHITDNFFSDLIKKIILILGEVYHTMTMLKMYLTEITNFL